MSSADAWAASEGGGRAKSGHVSGRLLSSTLPVKVPTGAARGEQQAPHEDLQAGPSTSAAAAATVTVAASHRSHAPSVKSGGGGSTAASARRSVSVDPPSSDDSFEEAPPRRRPQPINAELVKLVASFAPLELAQLKALEQKARLKKARAAASAAAAPVGVAASEDGAASTEAVNAAAAVAVEAAPSLAGGDSMDMTLRQSAEPAVDRLNPQPAPALTRPAHPAASGRPRSRSPTRSSHLPAAPAKGAPIRRDLNLLPNPLAQKQTEAMQRQAAASVFVHRLQREQDILRQEKQRRMQAEQEALAAQLAAEAEAAEAAATEVAQVPVPKPLPVKRKKAAPSTGGAPGVHGLLAAERVSQEKKPVDPKPWRQNMRQRPTPVASDAPAGAPPEVAARPVTDAPPPRNVSPGAAAARLRTLDPVARAQLKEFMDRKAKEVAARQQAEKEAQREAKLQQQKVNKTEMAKARERAQRYAEVIKDRPLDYNGPKPAWIDLAPPEGGGASALAPNRPARARRPPNEEPDFDVTSNRALPHHMSDAMRMEVAERRRQERLYGSAAGRPDLLDPLEEELGPQVVRVNDPHASFHEGRVYRADTARPTRPLLSASAVMSGSGLRQAGQPLPPELQRAMDVEARLALRKEYEQRLREVQAAERRDSSRGRDTSRGRDNSRGRVRSPTAGRKHHAVVAHSRSRSPPKRAKGQRSRSGSRGGSASRRDTEPGAPARPQTVPIITGPSDGGQLPVPDYLTAVQAEMQQVRNERHVGDLWDLALQLSARLGALQQQQGEAVAVPTQAWAEPRDQSAAAAAQLLLPMASHHVGTTPRASAPGILGGFPAAMAVVPTGLPDGSPVDTSFQASPTNPDELQFDEGVQAHVEFRSDVSWPAAAHKKPRLTRDLSSGGGSSAGGAAPSASTSDVAVGKRTEGLEGASRKTLSGFSVDSTHALSAGTASLAERALLPKSVALQTAPSMRAATIGGTSSKSRDSATSLRDQDTTQAKGASSSRASLKADQRNEGEDTRPRPMRTTIQIGGAEDPPSPSKAVPAAPIIQIPLPPATAEAAEEGVEPTPGLPYDNATFSAESADEGSSSGSEAPYGQRVLTIAELHDMLVENPHFEQRLSLDREREKWEHHEGGAETAQPGPEPVAAAAPRPSPSKLVQLRSGTISPQPPSAVAPDGLTARVMLRSPSRDSSPPSSAPGSPSRTCEAVVAEYERSNSPLKMRPAQVELLKAQAIKRAEEQQEQAALARIQEEEEAADADDIDAGTVTAFPKSGDPMSIINLIAHKGRVPDRPAIIQLSEPPLPDQPGVAEQETQTATEALLAGTATWQDGPSEVLVIPGSAGPQLLFSRELVQPNRASLGGLPASPPRLHRPATTRERVGDLPSSPSRAPRDVGVGDGEAASDLPDLEMRSAQLLVDSLPPYVLIHPADTQHQRGRVDSQQEAAAPPQPSMQERIAMLQEIRQAAKSGLTSAPAQRELPARAELYGGAGGASDGVTGVMASPPPRPRIVTFVDEPQLPPERVRLAPTELFRQMQDTLKSYQELDSAEQELQQLQNARAIAAVQREAHRIAQRLDQSAAAEAQATLIAHAQAEMEAKLRALEESLRSEVRKESLSNLHEVASMFVQQLGRNKVADAKVQTYSPPSSPSRRPEIGVQVDAPAGRQVSPDKRTTSPSPPRQTSFRATSPVQLPIKSSLRATSPPQTSFRASSPPQTSQRTASPPQQPQAPSRTSPPPQTSFRASSPPQTSLRPGASPPAAARHSPGAEGSVTWTDTRGGRDSLPPRRPSTATSNPLSDYSEVFEADDDQEPSGMPSGRPASRAAFRQASRVSIPASVYEEDFEAEEEEDGSVQEEDGLRSQSRATMRRISAALSVPESVSQHRPDRQPSRATLRQTSTLSIPESVYPERAPTRTSLRHQTSTFSVAESVYEEDEEDERPAAAQRPGLRSALRQPTQHSMAETVRSERAAGTSFRSAYTSAVGDSSVHESIPGVGEPSSRFVSHRASFLSGRSRRRRSTAADTVGTSEPGYSEDFEEEPEEDIAEEVTGGTSVTEEVQESGSIQEESSRRLQPRRSGPTTSSASTQMVDEVGSASRSRSRSYSEEVEDETGLGSNEDSRRVVAQPRRPQSAPVTAAPLRDAAAGLLATPVRTSLRHPGATASPLDLRASIEGGLELDDVMMASYSADMEARMVQELALLTDRLAVLNASAEGKMAQLEAELAAEPTPQRQQAIIRAQRLVQVQHDADAADLHRQISAVKADFARQKLMLERLYRLAQITSPAGAAGAKRAPAVTLKGAAERPASAPPAKARPAAAAPKPALKAQPSNSGSIAEEKSVQYKKSTSGSVAEERSALYKKSTTESIAEDSKSGLYKQSGTTSVLEESIPGTAPGRSSSAIEDEVDEDYSEAFEPASGVVSRRTMQLPGRPRPSAQPSSMMDEIEEVLSRRGTSGGQSTSIVTEDAGQRSGTGAATSTGDGRTSSSRQQGHSSSSIPESGRRSEDGKAKKTKAPAQQRSRRRSVATSDDLDGGASELSVLSADLERQQAELQSLLRRKEKEIRDKERRAKIDAKRAAVEALLQQIADLERRGPAVLPSTGAKARAPEGKATKPATRPAPARSSSEIVSETSMSEPSRHGGVGTESVADEVASETPSSLPEEVDQAESAASESIRSEPARGGRQRRDSVSRSVTESVRDTDASQEECSESYASTAAASGVRRRSGGRSVSSSEARAAQRLTALQQAVLAKEKELRRLQQKAEEDALQQRLRELEEQEKQLKSAPPPKPPKPPGAPIAPAVAARKPAAAAHTIDSYGTSARDSTVYSESFHSASEPAGGRSSASIADDVPSGGRAASGSRSASIAEEELSSGSAQRARRGGAASAAAGSRSASTSMEDETKRSSASASRSSGGGTVPSSNVPSSSAGRGSQPRGARSASVSDEVYDESFESGSGIHGASEVGEDSGAIGEGSGAAGASGLEPIDEEDARASPASSRRAASSIADDVRGESSELGHSQETRSAQDVTYTQDFSASAASHSGSIPPSGSVPSAGPASASQSGSLPASSIRSGSAAPASQSGSAPASSIRSGPAASASQSGTAPTSSIRSGPAATASRSGQSAAPSSVRSAPASTPAGQSSTSQVAPGSQDASYSQDFGTSAGSHSGSLPSGAHPTPSLGEFFTTAGSISGSVPHNVLGGPVAPVHVPSSSHREPAPAVQDFLASGITGSVGQGSHVDSVPSVASIAASAPAEQPSQRSISIDYSSALLPQGSSGSSGSHAEEVEERAAAAAESGSPARSETRSIQELAVRARSSPSGSAASAVDEGALLEDFEVEHSTEADDEPRELVYDAAPSTESSEEPLAVQEHSSSASVEEASAEADELLEVEALEDEAGVEVEYSEPSAEVLEMEHAEEEESESSSTQSAEMLVVEAEEESSAQSEEVLEVHAEDADSAHESSRSGDVEEVEAEDTAGSGGIAASLSATATMEDLAQPPSGDAPSTVLPVDSQEGEYELDFQASAAEVPSSRYSDAPTAPVTSGSAGGSRSIPTASGDSRALGTSGEQVQDASGLGSQTSLHEIPSVQSASSLKTSGSTQRAAMARGAGAPLQQQASTLSTATYEEDFEGEASETQLPGASCGAAALPQGATLMERTTLSVVDEEVEALQPEATGSRLYSEDFASSSTLLPGGAAAAGGAAATVSAIPEASPDASTTVSEPAPEEPDAEEPDAEEPVAESIEVEDVLEVDYEDVAAVAEAESEEQEDYTQQFSAASSAPLGPMLAPTPSATAPGMDASQRYGPASASPSDEEPSGGYSEEFPDDAEVVDVEEEAEAELSAVAEEEEASTSVLRAAASASLQAPSGGSEEPEASYTADFGATEEDSTLAPSAQPSAAAAGSTAVQQQDKGSAPEAQPPSSESASVFEVEEEGLESGTVSSEPSAGDLAGLGDAAAQPGSAAAPTSAPAPPAPAPAAPADVTSHPISQPPSPPAASDDDDDDEAEQEGGVEAAQEEQEQDSPAAVSEEALDVQDEEGDLDMSDLGLDAPPVRTTAAPAAAALAAMAAQRAAAGSPAALSGEISAGLGEPQEEDSGLIPDLRSRGIRQTRHIESRRWRNQASLLEEAEEEPMEGSLDLVDMSMTLEEGGAGGLLEMLGADFIEASEAITPSQSFRIRGEQSGASPYVLRSSLSSRLATLREQDAEDTEGSSEAMSPGAPRPPTVPEGDEQAAESEGEASEDAPEEPMEEEVVEEVEEEAEAAAESDDEGPFKQAAPAAGKEPAPAPPAVPAEPSVAPEAERSDKPAGAASTAAPPAVANVVAGERSSEHYSDDGLEAPAEEDSAEQHSVVEYDMHASAALAATDSDDLAEYAAAFESQAIGVDDDDDGVPAEHSGISASGLSDDLSKYKAAVHPDSDEEAVIPPRAAVAAPAAAATAAPEPAEPERARSPSPEASEVDDVQEVVEEPEASGGDPFSVDESVDRLPTLQPSTSQPAPPPLPHRDSGSAASSPAGPQARQEPVGEQAPAAAAQQPSSPTVSSPRSSKSSRAELHGETSLGPLPKSGLEEDDEEERGLEYRTVYKGSVPSAAAAAVAAATAAASPPPAGTSQAAAGDEPVQASDEAGGARAGLLDQLRAFAGSDDEEDEEFGSNSLGRGLSAASLKPAFQALLDQPDAEEDVPKGDFESEIEEMLAASRSKSRLMSPYQSREFGESEPNTPGESTPFLQSARNSLAGTSLLSGAAAAAESHASPEAAPATAPERLSVQVPAEAEDKEEELPEDLEAAQKNAEEASRNQLVDAITESTIKTLVADSVEAIAGVTGPEKLTGTQAVGAPLAAAAAAAALPPVPLTSPRGSSSSVQLLTQPKHRLSQVSSFRGDDGEPAPKEAPVAAQPAASKERSSSSSGGGDASISMSEGELEGDIELDADLEVEEPAMELPSPLASDSGSLGSPGRRPAAPALAPEPSDRDVAAQRGEGETSLGGGGVGLTSDEDLGWGGADEDVELEDWQPDVSGLIAPEIDQATIERENAPAVSTAPEAMAKYVEQVLDQFMENRPEFLVAGAEPLSLEGFLAQERRLADATEAQHIHNKMVYDAVNEALLAIYRSANRVQTQPWLDRNRVVRPLPSPTDMAEAVQKQIRTWSGMRMREPAEIDKVLAADAQDDERAWMDLAAEEAEVQREVAELIWDDLLTDTAAVLTNLEEMLSTSRGSLAGRRRMGALVPL